MQGCPSSSTVSGVGAVWGCCCGRCAVLGHRAAPQGSDVGAIWAEEPIRADPGSVQGLVLWDHPREDLAPWECPCVLVLQGLFPPERDRDSPAQPGDLIHALRSLEERSPRRAGTSHFSPGWQCHQPGSGMDGGVTPTRLPAAVPCPGQVAGLAWAHAGGRFCVPVCPLSRSASRRYVPVSH